MKEIRVLLTMDCEPTKATSSLKGSGPMDWAQGERAVVGYSEIARSYGFPVTYCIHPEAAIAQAGMFRELEVRGACLGLHLHPWKYSTWRHGSGKYFEDYGGLSEADQRSLLKEASGLWKDAIGHHPLYFRPGSYSANDAIYRSLVAEGFRGGQCSIPGRAWPDVRAGWEACEPDPHRAHADFRHIRGSLEFVNIPASADLSVMLNDERKNRSQHPDLRPDTNWQAKYGVSYETTAANIVAQIQEREPAHPVILILTHNDFEYSDPNSAVAQRLKAAVDGINKACSAAGIKPVGATMADVVDAVLSTPAVHEPYKSPESVRYA